MAVLNFAHREITVKVVYFGAPGAGSNTNVEQLHGLIEAEDRGGLHTFGPGSEEEQSAFFDYVPGGEQEVKGFSLRVRVYSLPGALASDIHRAEVMRDVDAVVFVADARLRRDQANLDAMIELEGALRAEALELAALPVVVQVNHTDDEEARPNREVTFDINPYHFPVVEAVARAGEGVVETHAQLVELTTDRIRDNLAGNGSAITLCAVHQQAVPVDRDVVAGHVGRIERASRAATAGVASGLGELVVEGEVEVGYQPQDFAGTRPMRILGAAIEGHDIKLDVVMERMSGGTPRRLCVHLANRPSDAPPIPRFETATATNSSQRSVLDSLPDVVELEPPTRSDFPPIWYGMAGLGAGVLIGVLLAFLMLY